MSPEKTPLGAFELAFEVDGVLPSVSGALFTLHDPRVIGCKSNALRCNLNVNSWGKVDATKKLVYGPRGRGHSSENGLAFGRHSDDGR